MSTTFSAELDLLVRKHIDKKGPDPLIEALDEMVQMLETETLPCAGTCAGQHVVETETNTGG